MGSTNFHSRKHGPKGLDGFGVSERPEPKACMPFPLEFWLRVSCLFYPQLFLSTCLHSEAHLLSKL